MYDEESCDDLNEHRLKACKPDSHFELHFFSPPFCASPNARRQLTKNYLAKQCQTKGKPARPLQIIGRKLHTGPDEMEMNKPRTRCDGRTTFDDERHGLLCTEQADVSDKFAKGSAKHYSLYDQDCPRCKYESFEDRYELNATSFDDNQLCSTCQQQQQTASLNASHKTDDERFEIRTGVDTDILHNSRETYRNVRADHNRLLKLLRRFDAIRSRARAAKETCLLRFEERQKQRLRLLHFSDLQDIQDQPKDVSQGAAGNDIEVLDRKAACITPHDVHLYDSETSAAYTTWPPVLDDSYSTVEPSDAVIRRLMSQFEQIRHDSVTARLENQKRFEANRKQRKYEKLQ